MPAPKDQNELQRFLAAEIAQHGQREVARRIGIAHQTLGKHVQGLPKEPPSNKTMAKISRAYAIPAWRIQQMAGNDLELPANTNNRARRLAALLETVPDLDRVVERLHVLMLENRDLFDGLLLGMEHRVKRRKEKHP